MTDDSPNAPPYLSSPLYVKPRQLYDKRLAFEHCMHTRMKQYLYAPTTVYCTRVDQATKRHNELSSRRASRRANILRLAAGT
eukprot:351570-Chlamydomonas_euryale.AAC.7